jgi:hypothetical protein
LLKSSEGRNPAASRVSSSLLIAAAQMRIAQLKALTFVFLMIYQSVNNQAMAPKPAVNALPHLI